MFCPQCQAEYRLGFTRCSDCDVDLVEELPSELRRRDRRTGELGPETETPDWGAMRTLWEGDSEIECAQTCRQLLEEGIRYAVDQSITSRGPRMGVDWKYQIRVPVAEYEQARKSLGYEAEDGNEQDGDVKPAPEMEVPAQDDVPVEDIHGDWNPRNWYPEDATAEVWRETREQSGFIIEMALKENRINYRVERFADGLRRVFVMPEYEARAREIVREVVEGVPPE